jgi:hypothetical protein
VTDPDPVLYWLEDGKFARAMRVGSGPNKSSILVVDLTTGDGPSVIDKPDWFAAGYVAAYGGLVPECADEGTEPGQWSYGVAQLPATQPADPEREQRIEEWSKQLCAANNSGLPGLIDQLRHQGVALMRSAPPAPAASSELLAAAESAMKMAGGRWCEWGERAIGVEEILDAAIASEKARQPAAATDQGDKP